MSTPPRSPSPPPSARPPGPASGTALPPVPASGPALPAGSAPEPTLLPQPACRPALLTTANHDRDAAGLRYVYPVVSRRAGGLSIGINLNTNNACNWACSYCQVPDLRRGAAPVVDLVLLRQELGGFVDQVVRGDFLSQRVPEGLRRLNDIAFSGNGEPTASPDFAAAVDVILSVSQAAGLAGSIRLVVISNGSHVAEATVQQALRRLAPVRGELWFKLDRGTRQARQQVNGVVLADGLIEERLVQVSGCLPTWVQTCLFAESGRAPGPEELHAYRSLLARARAAGARLEGVLLYSLARPSLQPGADQLAALPGEALERWADALREDGLRVRVSA